MRWGTCPRRRGTPRELASDGMGGRAASGMMSGDLAGGTEWLVVLLIRVEEERKKRSQACPGCLTASRLDSTVSVFLLRGLWGTCWVASVAENTPILVPEGGCVQPYRTSEDLTCEADSAHWRDYRSVTRLRGGPASLAHEDSRKGPLWEFLPGPLLGPSRYSEAPGALSFLF